VTTQRRTRGRTPNRSGGRAAGQAQALAGAAGKQAQPSVDYVEARFISLKNHPELGELWVQARIAENPGMLGLGEVEVKDEQRRQPHAGRLDMLLMDVDNEIRHELELQLGATDESHIIRTIEYWDYERRRYPQYDHCAVIVAEDITSRFLNVIALFNGFIPIIAIQLRALEVNEALTLVATTVMDRLTLGTEEEDAGEATDRGYWENRGSRDTVRVVDKVFDMLRDLEPELALKYNKYYIGLARRGVPDNFLVMRPRKRKTQIEFKIPRSDELTQRLEEAGLDLGSYDSRWNAYRVSLDLDDVERHADLVRELVLMARDAGGP
jgi:hypothetical protein